MKYKCHERWLQNAFQKYKTSQDILPSIKNSQYSSVNYTWLEARPWSYKQGFELLFRSIRGVVVVEIGLIKCITASIKYAKLSYISYWMRRAKKLSVRSVKGDLNKRRDLKIKLTRVLKCTKLLSTAEVCRIQVWIRTAKGADKLTIALDFALSVVNARKSCSIDAVYENTR